MPLALERSVGERIFIGDKITLTLLDVFMDEWYAEAEVAIHDGTGDARKCRMHAGGQIDLGGGIRFKVWQIRPRVVRFSIDAPKSVRIDREELRAKREGAKT